MEPTYKDMLLQILAVMNYKEKEAYVIKFEELNRLEAVMNCLELLPISIQEQIRAKQIDPLEVVKALPKDLFQQALIKVSAEALVDLMNQMDEILSNDQKKEIAHIIASY